MLIYIPPISSGDKFHYSQFLPSSLASWMPATFMKQTWPLSLWGRSRLSRGNLRAWTPSGASEPVKSESGELDQRVLMTSLYKSPKHCCCIEAASPPLYPSDGFMPGLGSCPLPLSLSLPVTVHMACLWQEARHLIALTCYHLAPVLQSP